MTRAELELLFQNGAPVRGVPSGVLNAKGELIGNESGPIIGKGLFEADLLGMGFEKHALKQLVKKGELMKVTTRYKDCWRNTYVLEMKE